ncbi:GerAB/ArcD/ProY family transporter [Haloimpatiens lingqiaonensis]|uniref:GerAB/ArcD/ProY family transporter n=1 Tax=Haloimpatiens lingqiaonensis TaxID=1380675 RepID=UPI0010FEE401|nr:GerAB/ArcD/ProY family transporter [Haloimpatiens lingqiaonensis]
MWDLSNRQIVFLIFGAVVGYGVLDLPKVMAEKAGTGGWFSLIITTIIAMIVVSINIKLAFLHNNKILPQYDEFLIGKFLGKTINLIYMIYFLLVPSLIVRATSQVIEKNILLRTPIWFLCLAFLATAYYALIRGGRGIVSICQTYGIIVIVSIIVLHVLILTQGKSYNVMPIFNVKELGRYLKAGLSFQVPFLGVEIFLFIPLNKEKNKELTKKAIQMLGFIGLMYILIVESSISVMSENDIVQYNDAVIATIRRIEIQRLEFFRRLDGLFIILWILSIFCTIFVYMYGLNLFTVKFFKAKNSNFTALIIIGISFIITQLPVTFEQVTVSIKYIGFLGILCSMIIPTILLIITKVKNNEKV